MKKKSEEILIQVTAPHFVAGVVAWNGRIQEAAPILRYMVGWDAQKFTSYTAKRGWSWKKSPSLART